MGLRTIFLGTPAFAVPSLEAIAEAGYKPVAVYTQPDRPKGRGQEVAMSAVKTAALALGIEVRQPERIRRPEIVEELRALAPDLMVVVGYGQIIPQGIIDIPRFGIVNVHGSLLPKYRGAAPIQWAIAHGEHTTGVTTMQINAGLDTGDMLLKAATEIGPDENATELGERLSIMGAKLLIDTIADLESGSLAAIPQDDREATHAPILSKQDGAIDWSWPAQVIHNRTRGLYPWPGTMTQFRGQTLRIAKTRVLDESTDQDAARVIGAKGGLLVACGQSTVIELLEVQQEGRKRVSGSDLRNGLRIADNEILGD